MFSKKHVHVLRKTRTTFSENTYVFFSGTNPDIDRHWPTALFSASYLCGKKKHMNKLACIGLITLSVLSCSVSRDSKQRLYKQEKDSISAIRIDHLFHKAGSDSQNHLSATLRQVTLSIPDSTGRQYPLSVTTATLRQRSRRSATDTSSRSSAQRSVQTGTATHVSQKSKERKRQAVPWWLWLAPGLALIVLSLIHI